jgi:hypothetical protein
MGLSNWPILTKALKDFNIQHFNQNATTNFDCLLIDKDLVINDPITCVRYFKHNMNNFCRLLKNIDILFGQIVNFFFNDKNLIWRVGS